ncbi:LysR substrate-binding domain-containing protein [Agrobacterium sp. SOY23]|uniref:LysR substrate-binding domain-containing protein n=1 Tax=Agrobacterium sp. SOY23 TaxID=3014555 RepID=UPI0022B01083|nr:LysR substrate-binding domain-containing protein [Agrobacterium sp. SOY23]MCZ4430448.1 LysR substrate-binding domain-containing protein [Agrobacterium sp. SOY23]
MPIPPKFVRCTTFGRACALPVAGSFQANDALALRRAAVGGMGIAMLPRFAAAGGRRRRRPFDCLRLRLDITLHWQRL